MAIAEGRAARVKRGALADKRDSGSCGGAAASLRSLLFGSCTARAVGAHDALSACLVEHAGFDAIWASGFAVSASRGLPDISLLTLTEQLEAAASMVRATSLPVLADCDTGFGSAANVAHMVRLYEAAGIAGVCIEDKLFPKANSFLAGRQELLDCEEFAHKLFVGKSVQASQDFVIVARTEAFICGMELGEALERAHRYAEAGADAILVHSKRATADEIEAFLQAWPGTVPIIAVPTTYYGWSVAQAEQAGVGLLIYANQVLRAAVRAIERVLQEIETSRSLATVEQEIASLDEIFILQDVATWRAFE